ncbi:hypothetical protein D4764_18G0011900 [Takifugu flavidus]|uniref:Uncharacterized protein n=1 Tax=Takifugu flavidus TaxID=433684 RepID=A0A5C6NSD7_9TELE|nr:hypothetical protein D4764_18G0011900 [Takifugu flavidus]
MYRQRDTDEGELGLCQPQNRRTYIMYHGTTRQKARSIQAGGFLQSPDGMLGRGVYLSRNLAKARRYPINHPENDKAVIKVRVNVGKVIAINYQGHPRQKTWHDHGYDTAWVPPRCGMVRSGLEEDCVWDPRRIQILKVILPEEGPDNGLVEAGIGAFLLGLLDLDVGEVMAINGLDQKTWQDSGYDSTWEPRVTVLTTPAGEVIGNRSGNGQGTGQERVREQVRERVRERVREQVRGQVRERVRERSGNGSGDSELKMYRQWEEDDFDLSTDEGELGLSQPQNGRTYIMYHGTTRQNARCIQARGFCQSPDGMLGPGVYLSRDLAKARRYPINHPENDKAVIKVRVNVGKVIAINYQGHPRQKTWHDYGYDTAWCRPVDVGEVMAINGLDQKTWQDSGYDSTWELHVTFLTTPAGCVNINL